MPLNESTARRPAMTPRQIQEAERAIFGIPTVSEGPPPDLTHQEYERMREMLHAHDRQHNKIQTIDLNNPPKEPYVYQEFPRMLYYGGDRDQYIIVQNARQKEIALARGYTTELAVEEPEPETPEAQPEEHDDAAFEAYLAAQQQGSAALNRANEPEAGLAGELEDAPELVQQAAPGKKKR